MHDLKTVGLSTGHLCHTSHAFSGKKTGTVRSFPQGLADPAQVPGLSSESTAPHAIEARVPIFKHGYESLGVFNGSLYSHEVSFCTRPYETR